MPHVRFVFWLYIALIVVGLALAFLVGFVHR